MNDFIGYGHPMLRGLAFLTSSVLLAVACAPPTNVPQPPRAASFDATALTTCEAAFRAWVDGAASLNSPGTNVGETLVMQEAVQRRVFELCSLAEAETFNAEMLVEYAPGVRQRLIEPNFRTFAEIECVDESPLLDGTKLCAEVGH